MQQMQIQMQMQMQASLLSQLQAAQQQLLPLQQQQHQQQQQPIHPLLATAISPAISSDDSFSVLLQSSSASPDPSFFLPTASASTSTTTSLYKSSPVASPAAGAPTQPPNASSFAAGNLDFSSLLDFSSYREASSTPPFDATGGSLYEEGGTGGRDSADLFDELNKMEQAQSPPLDAASSAGAGAQDKMVTKEVIQCTKIVKEELKTVTSLSPEDVAALCGEFQKCSTNAQKEGVTMNLCKDYNPDHQHLLNMQQKIMGKVHNEADKHKVQSILATAAGKMREKVELAALGFATTILD
ncbi:hypothetical protein BC830DRAFT_1096818 [Chytriomyces sp. MP71]|nr:hypothetical protein BC830DRAFT_1096818 [Chytriomyces sp. MP71]